MTHELSDRFSLQRLGMVARFYFPRLKKQIIFYPLLSLITVLLTVGAAKLEFVPTSLLTPLGLLSTLLLWLGPAVFTMQEGPETEALLPAKGSEKALFIILYSIVGIPLLINLFSFVTSYFSHDLLNGMLFGANATNDLKAAGLSPEFIFDIIDSIRQNKLIIIGSTLISAFPCLVTLYTVMRCHRHRIVWSLVWNAVYLVSLGVITFIAGFIAAIYDISHDKIQALSSAPTEQDAADIIQFIISPVCTQIFLWAGTFTVVCAVILLIATYRTIVNRQVA